MEEVALVTYRLPKSKDTKVFGPEYWAAFHDLANRIPCDGCREDTNSFMVFWHDLVNIKTGKKVYDQKNFNEWIKRVDKLVEEKKKRTDRKILGFIAAVVVSILIVVIIKTK